MESSRDSIWVKTMTDAAVQVTQSVVEEFTEQYLTALGSTIEKDGRTWLVTIPTEADTELPTEDIELLCEGALEDDEDGIPLHPESSFFHDLLEEASGRAPYGGITVDTDRVGITIPNWLQESEVSLNTARFVPYYDRTAIVALFRVSIETVSEYQQEYLRAIAIDTRSEEILERLDETVLSLVEPGNSLVKSEPMSADEGQVKQFIDSMREPLVAEIQPQIDEIHQEASRAADAEVEEYRKLQQQREQELEDSLEKLRSQTNELSETISGEDGQQRVHALKKRKELNAEYEKVASELEDLRQRRDDGFPTRQHEIRDRHALEVVVTPLTATEVQYERGELELELIEGESSYTATVGYGSGVGVTESVQCSECDRTLSGQHPLGDIEEALLCEGCGAGSLDMS